MITEDRLHHIIGVARLMKDYCIKNNYSEDYQKEMFTLGYLHDIGYEFGDNLTHAEIGGNMLKNQNYKYYNEVKYHGVPKSEYSSNELDLLNWADMHINGKGSYVTFEDRLIDIANRRGEDSVAYKCAKQVIEELKNKGFN